MWAPQKVPSHSRERKTIALDKIPVQSVGATGVKQVEPAADYQVEFNGDIVASQSMTQPKVKEIERMVCDSIKTVFWPSVLGHGRCKPEGLYVVALSRFAQAELVVVHSDGTAKRIDGSQFSENKTKTSIKEDKDGAESIYIAPVFRRNFGSNVWYRSYEDVWKHQIFQQGKAGGGVRAFYTTKPTVKVTDGKNSTVDISFGDPAKNC